MQTTKAKGKAKGGKGKVGTVSDATSLLPSAPAAATSHTDPYVLLQRELKGATKYQHYRDTPPDPDSVRKPYLSPGK